jgi:putative glycosyltransferase
MRISVVTTLYKSSGWINEFYERALAAVRNIAGDDYEIIMINDGSPDNVLDVVLEIARKNPRVTVVDLSRNFGHHKAIMAGLKQSRGDDVFLIDCDLEEAPELLLEFDREKRHLGMDVVYGVQAERKGGFVEKVGGAIFYAGFNRLSGIELPRNILTARLMSRDYVNALILHEERDLFLGGVMQITGFRQKALSVAKKSRGETSYTLGRRLSLLISAITSFSAKPLHFIFFIGVGIFFVSMICALIVFLESVFVGNYLTGWTSLILSIWILGGLTLASIGVVGIYIAKVFVEVKARPNSIIREIFNFGDGHE